MNRGDEVQPMASTLRRTICSGKQMLGQATFWSRNCSDKKLFGEEAVRGRNCSGKKLFGQEAVRVTHRPDKKLFGQETVRVGKKWWVVQQMEGKRQEGRDREEE
jgi:hypothetical protein